MMCLIANTKTQSNTFRLIDLFMFFFSFSLLSLVLCDFVWLMMIDSNETHIRQVNMLFSRLRRTYRQSSLTRRQLLCLLLYFVCDLVISIWWSFDLFVFLCFTVYLGELGICASHTSYHFYRRLKCVFCCTILFVVILIWFCFCSFDVRLVCVFKWHNKFYLPVGRQIESIVYVFVVRVSVFCMRMQAVSSLSISNKYVALCFHAR